MILLAGASRENAEMVSRRILNRLHKDFLRPTQDYGFRIADLEHLKKMDTGTGEKEPG